MKIVAAFLAGAAATILMIVMIALAQTSGQRVYNCSLAEISPDFPPHVREECRKLRRNSYARYQYVRELLV